MGPGGLVCFHGAQPHTVYEGLGYAEVVQVTLQPRERPDEYNRLQASQEMAALMNDYFGSFRGGGQRPTTNQGYQYRNCIGLPGGMLSPLYNQILKANVHSMNLVKGKGDDPDLPNTVYFAGQNLISLDHEHSRRNIPFNNKKN